MSNPTAGRRRLRDRLPVPVRQNWKPVAVLCLALAALLVFFGDVRVSPYVTSASANESDPVTDNVTGRVPLYDASVPHEIRLDYDQTDFDEMMDDFRANGGKDYIEADLTIDGTYLNDVGIRLKGNSTLASLRGGRRSAGRNRAGGGMPPAAGGNGPSAAGGQAKMRGGPGQYHLSADKPEELPWLIRIDKYVRGRAYQGNRQIALRPGSNGQVPLNEALTLSLMRASGQPAERYAFTRLRIDGRPSAARLLVENPSADYADHIMDGTGVMYKARAGGTFDDVGDDPTDYEKSFKQLNLEGSRDLAPVMRFLRWVNNTSDREFATDLHRYLDVPSFARYVATQNLVLNRDDMAGPGNNCVLWYDLDSAKFQVLGWDFNLTFSGSPDAGPNDSVGMRQPGGPGQTADAPTNGQAPTGPRGRARAQGPARAHGPGKAQNPAKNRDAGGRRTGLGGRSGNVLKSRFLDTDAFDAVYLSAYRSLYRSFYASGRATRTLRTLVTQAKAAGVGSGVDTAANTLRHIIKQRASALASNEVVTG